jgi:hypothetical protein
MRKKKKRNKVPGMNMRGPQRKDLRTASRS